MFLSHWYTIKLTLNSLTKAVLIWLALTTNPHSRQFNQALQTTQLPRLSARCFHQYWCLRPMTNSATVEINCWLLQYDILWNIFPRCLSHLTTYVCWFSPYVYLNYFLVLYPAPTLSLPCLIYYIPEWANDWTLEIKGNKTFFNYLNSVLFSFVDLSFPLFFWLMVRQP